MTALSDAVTAALAAEFPVVTPFARVTLTEAHQNGDALCARVQVVLLADGEIVDVQEQELYVCRPTPAAVAEAAAVVRTRVGRPVETMFGVVAHVLSPVVQYRPVPAGRGVRDIADAIYEQALEQGFEGRFYVVADWAAPARNVFFLVLANGELGGGGFESFLARAEADEIVGLLAALDATGCTGLARACRLALNLADTEGGIGTCDLDAGWLEEAKSGVSADDDLTWSDIDRDGDDGTYNLVKRELPRRLATYVEAQRAVLVA